MAACDASTDVGNVTDRSKRKVSIRIRRDLRAFWWRHAQLSYGTAFTAHLHVVEGLAWEEEQEQARAGTRSETWKE